MSELTNLNADKTASSRPDNGSARRGRTRRIGSSRRPMNWSARSMLIRYGRRRCDRDQKKQIPRCELPAGFLFRITSFSSSHHPPSRPSHTFPPSTPRRTYVLIPPVFGMAEIKARKAVFTCSAVVKTFATSGSITATRVAVQPGGDNRTIRLMKVMREIGKFRMVRRVVPA